MHPKKENNIITAMITGMNDNFLFFKCTFLNLTLAKLLFKLFFFLRILFSPQPYLELFSNARVIVSELTIEKF